MRYLPLFILLLLVTTMAVSTLKISDIKSGKSSQNSEPTKKAEDFGGKFHEFSLNLPEFELEDLFNRKSQLSKNDFSGQYSLVNFFASWCTTCLAEHQILMRIKSENLLPIYGIAWRDIKGETKKFLKKHGNPYQKVGIDSKGLFSKIGEVKAVPETWIVDNNGVVVRKITGNLQDYSIDEIKEFLQKKN